MFVFLSHCNRYVVESLHSLITNSRWFVNLNVEATTVKVLEENNKQLFSWSCSKKIFINRTYKVLTIKGKIDKLSFIKIKNLCSSKAFPVKKEKTSHKVEAIFNT